MPDLPTDVVAVLLRYVAPMVRLASCAFVCKAWHAACCSSIDSMSLSVCKQQQAHNAFSWLTKHGKGVTSVHMVVSEAAEKLCLDCDLQVWPWLKDLRLTGKDSCSVMRALLATGKTLDSCEMFAFGPDFLW